ncbi:winged helix-turn-helix transcriptional regulator [Lentzea tibetensis]|uniref:Winged helix-turn-helix transcriptional regulator n=1 Tax=Lentzea tibetensis TaxID=2591470 RepID=A0A563EZR4_9PSEU|nr:winged helix-turn-helix domain-containing protein [Lentzea tibetensis]TWP53220.1 winged helix-turn-helix transcriptional regulator [Lentzea tibetensis]
MNATPGLAAYQRVVEKIKDDIRSRRLVAGEKLPGNRALADDHSVALGTLQKALKILEDEGWVTATPAVGVFVNEPPVEAEPTDVAAVVKRLDDLQGTVEALTERVRRLEGVEG